MADEEGRYQMLWDCDACGTSELLALDHKFCPACGAPQDPEQRYFPSDSQKVAVEDHPYQGADRICPACDSPNAAHAEFCQACGSPLDGADAAATRQDRVVAEGEADAGETVADARAEAREERQEAERRRRAELAGQDTDAEEDAPTAKKGGMGWIAGGCLGLVALAAVLGVGFLVLSFVFQTSDAVTVQGHRWERTIQVERYGPVEKKAWRDELPRGADVGRCRQEVRETRKVQDGEECQVRKKDLGDGTFKEVRECEPTYREEKVKAEKCTYTVDAWTDARKEQAAGEDRSPSWPEVALSGPASGPGAEREGARKETYEVIVEDPRGQTHTCALPEDRWRALEPGQTVEASFGGLTGAIDCASLR
jgi:hypothetical protein